MHFLLYGENSFQIKEKTTEFEEKFKKESAAELNVVKLDGEKIKPAAFLEAIFAASFFGGKKLIEIKNLLLSKPGDEIKKLILENLKKIPEDAVVLFIEEGLPDARVALFKALNRPGKAQKFSHLDNYGTNLWIKTQVEKAGGEILPEATAKLAAFCGTNLWRLKNEIEKLVLFKADGLEPIAPADVELLVSAENSQSIFDFTDAIAAKRMETAVSILHNLEENGQNEQYLLSMIVYQYRQLLILSDLSGKFGQTDLAAVSRIHPYVVKKLVSCLKNYDPLELRQIFRRLMECDVQIKTGELEPGLALDFLVVQICGK